MLFFTLRHRTYSQKLLPFLSIIFIVVAGLLPQTIIRTAAQASAPPVRIDSTTNTIHIGEAYIDPAFASFPSHPDAPKDAITIPALRAALAPLTADADALLKDEGGNTWLLNANIVVHQTARLEITGTATDLAWLRLDSTPGQAPASTSIIADGGHLLVQGAKVTSWDASLQVLAVDENSSDGRSYLLAQDGGRMDIINAEVSHLGWAANEESGLTWRNRADASRPETGATGSVVGSDIHHNYFGMHASAAHGIEISNNDIYDNVVYGLDIQNNSTSFKVIDNTVSNNGKHGIVFSRGIEQTQIQQNEVFSNVQHGIVLERGSNTNTIEQNTVYGNDEGITIFQSSDNMIRNNNVYENNRGIRVHATYDDDDSFDGVATNNLITGNEITNNIQYGIYLHERADNNTIVDNMVTENASSGMYIRTGGNEIADNLVRNNGYGISLMGETPYRTPANAGSGPAYVAPLGEPATANWVYRNQVEGNSSAGIQIRQGFRNVIGPKQIDQQPDHSNFINTNNREGVLVRDGSAENVVVDNVIHGNTRDGVLVQGATTVQNRISQNSITANGRQGIQLSAGANADVAAPIITSAPGALTVTGTGPAGATIEVYRDLDGQGNVYEDSTTASTEGTWSLTPQADNTMPLVGYTAIAIDSQGNTSAFGGAVPTNIVYELGLEDSRAGDPLVTIFVKNSDDEPITVTLPDIQAGLRTITTTELLEDQGNDVWQLNANLFIRRGVTLSLTSETVTWLKLRSQGGDINLAADKSLYNYKSFVTLRTHDGTIIMDGVKVTSWDPELKDYDRDLTNGRSYVLAKYDARLDINESELSYLGFADGESYGISWRDINDPDTPDELRTRVTGTVRDSVFSFSYFGIYTYQASDMVFERNKFHDNVSYGFDPHDYSTNFLVKDNESFNNGNHGFIISRGCNNFVFQGNKSYNNRYSVDDSDRFAHGFMLDPGSPNSRYPQVPSFDNLYENNEAFDNDGYGFRILGSNDNIIRDNTFTNNLQGVTLEQESNGNVLENNMISRNQLYGVFVFRGANANTITGNTISQNGIHGVYLKSGPTTITNNTIIDNGTVVDNKPDGAGIATLRDNTPALAAEDFRLPGAETAAVSVDLELLGTIAQVRDVQDNVITNNTVARNADEGIELKHASNTLVEGNIVEENGTDGIYMTNETQGTRIAQNTVRANGGNGIKANGEETVGNTWTQNAVFNNRIGGIVTTSSANNAIRSPQLIREQGSITGTATPGAVVELFSDDGGQGRYFEARTTADDNGRFSFGVVTDLQGASINATATDIDGNSSPFTYNVGYNPDVVSTPGRIYLPLVVR